MAFYVDYDLIFDFKLSFTFDNLKSIRRSSKKSILVPVGLVESFDSKTEKLPRSFVINHLLYSYIAKNSD